MKYNLPNITLLAAFAAAAFAGAGWGIHKFYIVHLLLLIILIKKLFIEKDSLFFRPIPALYFFYSTIIWFCLHLPFVENISYALKHLAYVTIGVSIIHILYYEINSPQKLGEALWGVALAASLDIIICVAEIMGIFRYPISKFSAVSADWGFPNDLTKLTSQALVAPNPSLVFKTFMTTPTGFHYNPNQLAVAMCFLFPFALLHKKWYVSFPFLILIIGIILMASARLVFYTICVLTLLSFFIYTKKAVINYLYAFWLILGIFIMGYFSFPSSYLQIAEVTHPVLGIGASLKPDNSSQSRKTLIIDGLVALKANYGIGLGGGNGKVVQEQKFAPLSPPLVDMHNFWVELLVEGGVIYAFCVGIAYISWLRRLWHISQSPHPIGRYIGQSLLFGTIAFFFTAIAPASCIYFLPMYLFLGISLSIIRLYSNENLIISG